MNIYTARIVRDLQTGFPLQLPSPFAFQLCRMCN